MPNILSFHTCARQGSVEFVEENAPFISRYDEAKPKRLPFLGEGRYLWDDDMDSAHWWGKSFHKDEYYIVQVDVLYEDQELLDLCDRAQLRKWDELVKRLESIEVFTRDLPVGKLIELLRELHARHETWNLFPYTFVRAQENKANGTIPRLFRAGYTSYLETKPIWILCLFSCFNLNSLRKRVVYAS